MLDIESIRNTIVNGDCLEVMRQLPDESIDLAVTSPPYNMGGRLHPTNIWRAPALADGYKNYDDKMKEDEYVEWQRVVIAEIMRLLKDDGALFYNHKWPVRKKLLVDRHNIVDGFPVRQIIIWQRSGGINFVRTHFLPTYEVVYLIAKKNYLLSDGKNKHGDIWRIHQESNNDHPAPFPVELPSRAISSSLCMERKGSIVLDPFMGSGTTAVAALMNNNDFIGIEQSEEYCKKANERINVIKGMGAMLNFGGQDGDEN